MNEQGKAKADELRAQARKHHKLAKREDKTAALRKLGPAGTPELKRMRDVRYSTDKAPTAGKYWNPEGKRHVKGSEGKARNILRGFTARKKQGTNLPK